MYISDPVELIPGVGPKNLLYFHSMNIYTVKDLIYNFPYSYKNYILLSDVADADADNKFLIKSSVLGSPSRYRIRNNLSKTVFYCESNENIICVSYFNQDYLRFKLKENTTVYLYGKIFIKNQKYYMDSPEIHFCRPHEFLPVYSLTSGLSKKIYYKILLYALDNLEFNDYFDDSFLFKYNLCSLMDAFRFLHKPSDLNCLDIAHKRIVFDEFLFYNCYLYEIDRKINIKNTKVFSISDYYDKFLNKIPFKLTEAQIRSIHEIESDLVSNHFMNRLLQGDVGSGKTLVAFYSMFLAGMNGYQSVLMAPTEVLALQHYSNALKFFDEDETVLLTGSLNKKNKEIIREKIKNGSVKYVICTHALLYSDYVFDNIGFAVIDEQHKFGVNQRAKLFNNGNLHFLTMSATPIPRSLAIVLYGKSNVSNIDELPPGRKKINTFIMSYAKFVNLEKFILEHIRNNEQVYCVCPSISFSSEENNGLISVDYIYKRLKKDLPTINISYLHGKMSDKEKEVVLSDFFGKNIDVLVSTTVVEVGVDIPDATIMCIFDADRFGLSQLHQLRGRVGRGSKDSYCFLLTNKNSSYDRLKVIAESDDGFYIANKDLEMRGAGDILGTKQHGDISFDYGNILTDYKTFEYSKKVLLDIINDKNLYSRILSIAENKYNNNDVNIVYN